MRTLELYIYKHVKFVCKGSGFNGILQIFVCILQQATPEQLRLAQLTSVNSKEDAEFEKKVIQVKMILFRKIFQVVPFSALFQL